MEYKKSQEWEREKHSRDKTVPVDDHSSQCEREMKREREKKLIGLI